MTAADDLMTVADDVLVARAYLGRVAEAGSVVVAAFVEEHGPVTAAELIRAGAVSAELAAATVARRTSSDGEADLAAAARHGLRFVVPESPDWPHFAFAPLYAAQQRRWLAYLAGARSARYGGEPTVPLGMWVAGSLPVAESALRSVAVVGARAATAYGEQCASEFGYGLARAGITVVSGGAFGIDACAHRGALAADGATVLVSAGGLDRPYPGAHRNLFDRVRETGLVISESPPGAAPQKHRFLSRNRVIAALSSATLVIEAAPRSGALNTAAHCTVLGRPLLAVPGPITSAMSAGCHQLLRREDNPAQLVTSVDDVLEIVGPIGATDAGESVRADAGAPTGRGARVQDELDPAARAVLDGFPARGWVTENDLALSSALAIPAVLQALPILRLAGLIEFGPDGARLRREARP
jgi:DNA processing protein